MYTLNKCSFLRASSCVLYRHARFAHLTGRRHHSNDTTCQDASSPVLPGCKLLRSRQVSIRYA